MMIGYGSIVAEANEIKLFCKWKEKKLGIKLHIVQMTAYTHIS